MYRRLALIIGNDYDHEKLNNCVTNANDFADVLKQKCNYQVEFKSNLKSEEMHETINKFILSIKTNDFIIFYFSGHAAQWRDQNFLLPFGNEKITSAKNMHRFAINAQSIIDDMAEVNPHAVLFLFDCYCSYSIPTKVSNNISTSNQIHGLNEMKAPEKTLIAFPDAANKVLLNQTRSKNNGLFTKYLIEHITTPGVPIETILTKVANDIIKDTHNVQKLYRVGSLNAEVIFVEHVANTPEARKQKSNPSNVSTINSPKNKN
ncbi:unnamed protein product, partial [Rotaria sordida]